MRPSFYRRIPFGLLAITFVPIGMYMAGVTADIILGCCLLVASGARARKMAQ